MNQKKTIKENPEILLRAENLHFTYEGEDSPALNGLSLTIKRGKKIDRKSVV